MEHSFDVKVAEKVGIEAAILLKNIYWWCKHNCANGKNVHEGQAWTFNSRRAYAELFPYMKDSRIRAALKLLQDGGYIKTGSFNKIAYDRTTWYTVTEAGCELLGVDISHLLNTPMDLSNTANGSAYTPNDLSDTPMEESYTPDDTRYKPYINTDIKEEEEADWQAVLKAYQDNVRPALGPMDFEMLASLHKDFGKEWVLAGIEECVKSNVRNIRYLSSVLERWKTEGFKHDNRRKKENPPVENAPSDGRPPHIPAHWVKTGSGWCEPYIE